VTFFFITTLAALPGLWLLWKMRVRINSLDNNTKHEQVSPP
jgi:hypothetical protein